MEQRPYRLALPLAVVICALTPGTAWAQGLSCALPVHGHRVGYLPVSVDLDGQNGPDVIALDGDGVGIMLNRGDGTFELPTRVTAPGARQVVIADVDQRDGDDLVLAVGGDVAVLLNNGDNTFAPAVSYPVASWIPALAVGDLNADGWGLPHRPLKLDGGSGSSYRAATCSLASVDRASRATSSPGISR